MTSTNKPSTTDQTIVTIPKANDLETHLRIVKVDGVRALELRDYIPSLDEYGRGYWLPLQREPLNELLQAMVRVCNEYC